MGCPSGGQCTNYAGSTSYGGYHGFSGCGGHMVTSIGANYAAAYANLNENWYQIKDDSRDSTTGSGYVLQYYQCNYDCNNWPFNIPD